MARIVGDKAFNAKMKRLSKGVDVTKALLAGAERTRQAYVEAVNSQSGGRPEIRYSPRRSVTVSSPGSAPNTDTGTLVNSTGTASAGRNQAETFVSASYANALEFGTSKMAPRPAMGPAFEETKASVLADISAAVKAANRG